MANEYLGDENLKQVGSLQVDYLEFFDGSTAAGSQSGVKNVILRYENSILTFEMSEKGHDFVKI